jgi:phosphatidylinositol glycan class B
VLGLHLTMRLADKLRGPRAALVAGVLGLTFPAALLFGTRCLSEIASAPCLVGATLLVLEPTNSRRVFAAGMLAALACFLRFQNGIIALGLLLVLLMPRRFALAARYVCGGALIGVAGALLDYLSWGQPFHSLAAYVRFNLSAEAAKYGVAPWWFYAKAIWDTTGIAAIVIAGGLALTARRHAALFVSIAVYVLLHMCIPHKELRFMMPVVPLALALAAAGLADVGDVLDARTIKIVFPVAIAVVAGAMLHRADGLKGTDLGDEPIGERSTWHFQEGYNRLLWRAGERADLCGVSLGGVYPVWTGGYSYLHRNVPILMEPPYQRGALYAFNYVIAPPHLHVPPDFVEVDGQDDVRLLRRDGPCSAPPSGWAPIFAR